MVARFKDVYWSVVYTHRGDMIRIISVRKSRENEKKIYQH
ncbi:MAG: BrnT family toxin [Bacteroidetes bacterium]|nr:BrnT family toxin [Bacteroidota bacterium]